MVYAIGFAAIGSQKTGSKPVPVYYQQYGVEVSHHGDHVFKSTLNGNDVCRGLTMMTRLQRHD